MRDCYGYKFYLEHVFIHTPILTNVNRGYILGEIHRVSTQILNENACKYNIKHKQTYNKNQKAISEMSGFSFFVIIIADIDLTYWMIYVICTLK